MTKLGSMLSNLEPIYDGVSAREPAAAIHAAATSSSICGVYSEDPVDGHNGDRRLLAESASVVEMI